ncbi:transposase [Actinomyces qiguomingii]|uniref:transposase n=1 Tax=Actinomyces qiguomingii TaxID=2057800 RepID=UPI00157FA7BA
MTAGSAQRKYPEELRERATRMAVEARRDPERSKGAIRRIAEELGVHPEALRTWVIEGPRSTRAPGREPPVRMLSGSGSWRPRTAN